MRVKIFNFDLSLNIIAREFKTAKFERAKIFNFDANSNIYFKYGTYLYTGPALTQMDD
jgi:hypothetical protein